MNEQYQTPAPGSPVASGIPEQERTPVILQHLSPLADFVLPSLGSLLGPLVAWLIYRDRSKLLDQQGKEVLNFRISVWLYGLVITTLGFILFGLGLLGGAVGAAAGSPELGTFAFLGSFAGFFLFFLPVLAVMWVVPLVFMLIAVIRVSQGLPYRYPFTIRFLR